jgi:copper homeostasis protein
MQNRFALEICVESVERAIAAERGGAHRVELCSDLASGGITPSAGTMRVARQNLRIPIHVLIRPRAGDFVYSDREFEVMERDIELAQQLGMNSVVLGILDNKFQVDVERTTQLSLRIHSRSPFTGRLICAPTKTRLSTLSFRVDRRGC